MATVDQCHNLYISYWCGAWLIYAPGLLHLRRNGELSMHVLQEIGFSSAREETGGLFIHTGLDPHPLQFFPALVCHHVHTGSSIKHQARCEGMRQLRPRYSWGPHPRVTKTRVGHWHQIISKLTNQSHIITIVLLPVICALLHVYA